MDSVAEGVLLSLNVNDDLLNALAEHIRADGVVVLADPSRKRLTCMENESSEKDKSRYDRMCSVVSKLNLAKVKEGSDLEKKLIEFAPRTKSLAKFPLMVLLRKVGALDDLVPLQTNRELLHSSVSHVGWLSGSGALREVHLHRIASYAGPHVSLYFRFMQNYTTWLIIPAIISVVFELSDFTENVKLSPFLLGWGLGFLWLSWKPMRAENEPMNNKEEETQQLFAYHTDTSSFSRFVRSIFTWCLFCVYAVVCTVILFTSLRVRWHLIDPRGAMIGSVVYSAAQALLSLQCDFITRRLTSWEHHAEDAGYEKSRLRKAIAIRVILYFAFPIHLAITAPFDVLRNFVSTTFTIKQVTQAITEMAPWMMTKLLPSKRHLSPAEGESWNVNDEYLEMAVQFASLLSFGFVFPLSFLFAFLNNVLEGHFDAEKLSISKRTLPINLDLAALWIDTFGFLTFFGAGVNLVLIARIGSVDLAKAVMITILALKIASFFLEKKRVRHQL